MTAHSDVFPLDSDKLWLHSNQPGLNLFVASSGDVVIKGVLRIHHQYNDHPIDDSYKIRVVFMKALNYRPTVTEAGGRLDEVMARRGLSNVDLHMYESDTLCLMTPQEMDLVYLPNKSIRLLISNYLIPYFYSQSYFDKNDGCWPWPHHSHNLTGLLEWYRENHLLLGAAKSTQEAIRQLKGEAASAFIARGMRRDSFNPNNRCLCGSKQSYLRCDRDHRCYTKLALAIRFGY